MFLIGEACRLQTGVDDVDEGGLQAGTADEETIDIGLLGQLLAVLLADGAAVDDADVVGGLGGDGVGEPLADGGVDLLGLLGGGDLAGANGPVPVSRRRSRRRGKRGKTYQTGS